MVKGNDALGVYPQISKIKLRFLKEKLQGTSN